MKKLKIPAAALFLFLLFGFSSCKKDDDNPPTPSANFSPVGTWRLISSTYELSNTEMPATLQALVIAKEQQEATNVTMQFNTGGTGTWTEAPYTGTPISWIKNSDTLKINLQSSNAKIQVLSPKSNSQQTVQDLQVTTNPLNFLLSDTTSAGMKLTANVEWEYNQRQYMGNARITFTLAKQ